MRFLYGKHYGPDRAARWTDLFDVVIVGSCKPAFLLDKRRALYRVIPNAAAAADAPPPVDGILTNTKGVEDVPSRNPREYLAQGKIFQEGNWTHLHGMLDIVVGSQVLYVGDHMYSDILRSKRELGWRTMLVIPELEHEVNVMLHESPHLSQLNELRILRDELDEWVDRLHSQADAAITDNDSDSDSESPRALALATELRTARADSAAVKTRLALATKAYHHAYHPIWGQLFKTGYQHSRFAAQVEDYACLYAARVTNLARVSPEMHFRCMDDALPHDRIEESPIRRIFRRRMGGNEGIV